MACSPLSTSKVNYTASLIIQNPRRSASFLCYNPRIHSEAVMSKSLWPVYTLAALAFLLVFLGSLKGLSLAYLLAALLWTAAGLLLARRHLSAGPSGD